MAKTLTATGIGAGNHDWDFEVDEDGKITALFVKGSVEYDGGDVVRGERFDIWGGMTPTRKAKVQTAYTAAKNAFDNHFLE